MNEHVPRCLFPLLAVLADPRVKARNPDLVFLEACQADLAGAKLVKYRALPRSLRSPACNRSTDLSGSWGKASEELRVPEFQASFHLVRRLWWRRFIDAAPPIRAPTSRGRGG